MYQWMRRAMEPEDQRAQNKVGRVEQRIHYHALLIDRNHTEAIRNNRQQHHPNHRVFAYSAQNYGYRAINHIRKISNFQTNIWKLFKSLIILTFLRFTDWGKDQI